MHDAQRVLGGMHQRGVMGWECMIDIHGYDWFGLGWNCQGRCFVCGITRVTTTANETGPSPTGYERRWVYPLSNQQPGQGHRLKKSTK